MLTPDAPGAPLSVLFSYSSNRRHTSTSAALLTKDGTRRKIELCRKDSHPQKCPSRLVGVFHNERPTTALFYFGKSFLIQYLQQDDTQTS